MNDPTSILEQARRLGDAQKGRDIVATTTRRCACVLALVLLFLISGFGSMPNLGSGAQGLELRAASEPAQAETLANEGGYNEESLSVRTRHKTH